MKIIPGDGFDRNVAEKMPKVRRLEEGSLPESDGASQAGEQESPEIFQEAKPHEKPAPKRSLFDPPNRESRTEDQGDILRLIEDLHSQLLASGRSKRGLELDLAARGKTIEQLAQDNKTLRAELESLRGELRSQKDLQSESVYLREENADALERIQEFHEEIRTLHETLSRTGQERDEALGRIRELESRLEENEIVQMRGRMREREASHFSEENLELRTQLQQALAQNSEIERKHEKLRKSFNEVKESLALLRDSCRTSYYNLSDMPEEQPERSEI
jgi:DNA repair exonuclease SbcCD ATPase subunit